MMSWSAAQNVLNYSDVRDNANVRLSPYLNADAMKNSVTKFLNYVLNDHSNGDSTLFGCEYVDAYRDFTDRIIMAKEFLKKATADNGITPDLYMLTRSTMDTPVDLQAGELYNALDSNFEQVFDPSINESICNYYNPYL
jgi:hypothetical protein